MDNMSDMLLKDLNIENIFKIASIDVDQITCIECCKYYSVPTTAICGHTLCHSCWRIRKTCPSCGLEIEEKALTLNVPLQSLKEHICNFVQTYENLFNVKFEDFWSNIPAKNESEDLNKNVKAWLTSSENHFSAPVTDSQQSALFQSMEQALDQTTKQVTSDIQIQSVKENISKLSDVVHIMPQQNDWDKIEEMPEIENNQENAVGPMDIEPFDFLMNDKVYTPTSKNNDIEIQKVNFKDKLTDIKESTNENNNSTIMINKKQDSISSNKSTANNTSKLTPQMKVLEKENHIQYTLKNTQPTVSKTFRQVDPPKVCFFKKGALYKSFDKTVNPDEIPINQNKNSDKLTCNTDDVEISIKIGGTITNIYIKKKENDVLLKINSDREIQTSLINLVKEKNNTSCTPTHNVTERQNINSQNNNNLIINEVASAITKVQNMEKFTPSKKNTASADTATIQNERTESLEKELANTANAQFVEQSSAISQPQPTAAINVMEQDSENMNYDAIMSQVFANIDADMGKLPNSNNRNKSLQNPNNGKLSENNEIAFSSKSNTINNKDIISEKFSENIFSLSKGGQDSEIFVTSNFKTFEDKENTKNAIEKPYGELESMSTIRKEKKKQLSQTPDLDIIELSTPVHDEDSDKSVVEETPQKYQSFTRNQNRNEALMRNTQQSTTKAPKPTQSNMGTEDGTNIISLSDTMEESTKRSENVTVGETKRPTLETPLNITKFVDQIKHKSTPVSPKSLNFASRRDDDPEQNNNSTIMINKKQDSISSNKSTANNTSKLTPQMKVLEKENHIQYTLKNTQPTVSKTFRQVDPPKVCFFKKGALYKSFDKTVNPDEIPINQNKNSDKLTCNTDDVEISIKIGGTITNIYIKKKENDVLLKINSDREIQTSLINLVKEKNNTSCTPTHNVTERQNINSQNNNNLIINEVASAITKVQNMEKFTPSKKNTASADTATIQNERTESLEKELANTANAQFVEQSSAISQPQPTAAINVMEQDSENMNYDAIMSQVFANIDADMGKLPNSNNRNKSLQNPNNGKLSENNEIAFSSKSNTINNKDIISEKFSENIFSLSKGGQDSEIFVTSNIKTFEDKENTKNAIEKPYGELESMSTIRKEKKKQLSQTPNLDIIELSTPVHDEDSDKSVVEETPQKYQSFTRNQNRNEALMRNTQQSTTKAPKPTQSNMGTEDGTNIISLSDTMEESTKRSENVTVGETKRPTLETPLNITKFVDQIKHKSTPVSPKSLNFASRRDDDPEQILCPSTFVAANTTQEKEFLSKAFNQSLNSPTQTIIRRRASKLCVAGSCLTTAELINVKFLCSQRKWTFVNKYTKDLTHLVVGVDEENKSQRTVKYMCALAGAKWIVSYTWVERCLETNSVLDEEAFEALDGKGEPGPRRSRLSKKKLFEGITFYCMPPFSVLDIDTFKDILQWAGGRVVEEERAARAGPAPALLLAEPEYMQVDRLIYLTMELEVVSVNYEWVLNCLGSYTLSSIRELLLCPASRLPKVTAKWPSELMSYDYE